MCFTDLIERILADYRGRLIETYKLDCPPHVIYFEDTDVLMITITVGGEHSRCKLRDFADTLRHVGGVDALWKKARGMLSNNLYTAWQKTIYTDGELERMRA